MAAQQQHVEAFFINPLALRPESKFEQYINFDGKMKEFAQSDKDISTFLRKLKEESDAKIKDAIQKK